MEYPEIVEDALEELRLETEEKGLLLFEDFSLSPYRIFYLHHLSIQYGVMFYAISFQVESNLCIKNNTLAIEKTIK